MQILHYSHVLTSTCLSCLVFGRASLIKSYAIIFLIEKA